MLGIVQSNRDGSLLSRYQLIIKKEEGVTIFYLNFDRDKLTTRYMIRWLRLKQEGITLQELLCAREIYSIVIYGFIDITKSIIIDLENTNINIGGIIDKNAKKINYYNYKICSPDELVNYKNIDAILLMPVAPYQELIFSLKKYTNIPVLSFEELLYEL